ncbi:hypothetical protein CCZ01_05850 [Helicobacter monodelphidis]|uniref:hypothetical protein n=1 Tax=Helicobacter sp. 15-1451 TaxID=2004995 RepID=UPI000DCEB626|nr:hypothetical protein [Helicobacter sp. 15-1451]RAX57506.1 hypothetical protein CCZ01_05850 [Helicobacter sp. 15-1451]
MKNYFLIILFFGLNAFSHAVEIAGFEFSPEFGGSFGVMENDWKDRGSPNQQGYFGAYGRVWLGVAGISVAPIVQYQFLDDNSRTALRNLNIGGQLGGRIDLAILSLTPYVGIAHSSFNRSFEDTQMYSVGLKLKPSLIPLATSLQYTYQKPQYKSNDNKVKMDAIQLMLGLHF